MLQWILVSQKCTGIIVIHSKMQKKGKLLFFRAYNHPLPWLLSNVVLEAATPNLWLHAKWYFVHASNYAIMHVFLNRYGKLARKNINQWKCVISCTDEIKQHWPWRVCSWPLATHLAVCPSHSPAVEACPTPAHTASEVRSEPCAVLKSVPPASSNHQTACTCVGVR